MKKLLLKGIAIIVALTFVFSFTIKQENNVYAKKKEMIVYSTPSIKNIKIEILHGKKASYYKIYKATLSKAYVEKAEKYVMDIPKKKYKLLKKTKKRTYVDKKVKKKKYYSYIVKSFNKKGKCIEKYDDRYSLYCTRYIGKLDSPWLNYDNFDGEGVTRTSCSSKKLIFHCGGFWGGPCPTSYIVYRKEEGKSKYKKLFEKKEVFRDGISAYIVDKKVKANHRYSYKVKFCIKTKKKKYYSKMSNEIKLWAVDLFADYDIKCLTDPFTWDCTNNPNGTHDFVFSITDKNTNGNSNFYPGYGYYALGSEHTAFSCSEYSYNNKDWNTIPKEGVKLLKSKELYLKCKLLADDLEWPKTGLVYFGGSSKNSMLFYNEIGYDGPIGGTGGEGVFDFGSRSGYFNEHQAD